MTERCLLCIDKVVPATKQVLVRQTRPGGTFYTSPALCDDHAKHYGQGSTRVMVICELDL